MNGILQRTPHTAPNERVKIGIQRLLDTDVYISAFPLHDGMVFSLEIEVLLHSAWRIIDARHDLVSRLTLGLLISSKPTDSSLTPYNPGGPRQDCSNPL